MNDQRPRDTDGSVQLESRSTTSVPQHSKLVFAVSVIGLLLRLYRIDAQSLWVDEAATYISSVGSTVRVITQTDVASFTPPLYFLVVNRMLALGDAEALLRMPSAIFGAASIPLVYAVARFWVRDAVAALSAVLFAASPLHVWYSQEARAYALLLFLSLAALLAMRTAFAHPESTAARVAFVVFAAAAFYSHTVALAFIVVAAAIVAIHQPPGTWPRWIAVFVALGLLVVPGFAQYFTVGERSAEPWLNPVGPAHVGFMFWAFSTGYSMGPSVADLHEPEPLRIALASAHLIAPVMLGVAALLLLGGRDIWRRSRAALSSIVLLVIAPLAFSILGAMVMSYAFNVRYVIVALPGFLILLASGILAIRWPPMVWAATATVLLVDAAALRNYYHSPRYAREDNRGASAFIERVGSLDTEMVVVSAPYVSLTLDYYLRHAPRLVAPFPGGPSHGQGWVAQNELARLFARRERFWLYLSRTYHSRDAAVSLQRYADSLFVRDTAFRGVGVEVIRYVGRR